ncbi:phosphate signaling complex protein PhoU [Virgibacillus sp. W0430]|uniref:phosphate signaling complex protein PhoU n=1 Tax=Virgibacillus sp. W0430 TaxID=3391580 RepID=UPI003F461FA5
MNIRGNFHSELQLLKTKIITLAEMTEEAFILSIDALHNQDVQMAKRIIVKDKEIDRCENEINNQAVLMLAKQQPVATDLRMLISAIKITNDLERMGDNAKNIAKSTVHLGDNHNLIIHYAIKEMRDVALNMLKVVVEAFREEDIAILKSLAIMDDEIDQAYGKLIKEMLKERAVNMDKNQYILQMTFNARYIERFADHITNIGESIVFLVKGEAYQLN